MALLPSPATLRRSLHRVAVRVARAVLRIEPEPPGEFRKVPDDLPRDAVFSQPLEVGVSVNDPTPLDDGTTRVEFRVVVRDAKGMRCPDLFVQATVEGPERTATGDTTTDMLGAARFRMAGPPGTYSCTVHDVAAGALEWGPTADGSLTATFELSGD